MRNLLQLSVWKSAKVKRGWSVLRCQLYQQKFSVAVMMMMTLMLTVVMMKLMAQGRAEVGCMATPKGDGLHQPPTTDRLPHYVDRGNDHADHPDCDGRDNHDLRMMITISHSGPCFLLSCSWGDWGTCWVSQIGGNPQTLLRGVTGERGLLIFSEWSHVMMIILMTLNLIIIIIIVITPAP